MLREAAAAADADIDMLPAMPRHDTLPPMPCLPYAAATRHADACRHHYRFAAICWLPYMMIAAYAACCATLMRYFASAMDLCRFAAFADATLAIAARCRAAARSAADGAGYVAPLSSDSIKSDAC